MLGEPARKAIKGNDLDYYLNLRSERREQTMGMGSDPPLLAGGFTSANNESKHNGLIKLLKSQLPGAKSAGQG